MVTENFRTFDPCTLLAPVPAVMVSCKGRDEKAAPNIVTVAWVGTVNSEPPMVSISLRKERFSHALVEQSGEFVVNLVDEPRCKAADFCGVRSGRDVDKFAACGLTAMPALNMQYAPAIAQCPAYLACKVRQVLELGSHDMFIGEVVGVQVREDLFAEDGSLHLERAGLIAYNHGVYQSTADVLGFFGHSVARPDVLERRMKSYRTPKD
ncbi:MAG: flavin reductase family protein [bacterium]|nr:flavin reductase family protein [bacterium]